MIKKSSAYKSISEVAELLNLINNSTGKPNTHTLRYWETQFSQIKPTLINKRRYYTKDQIDLIRLIKFLLNGINLQLDFLKSRLSV